MYSTHVEMFTLNVAEVTGIIQYYTIDPLDAMIHPPYFVKYHRI